VLGQDEKQERYSDFHEVLTPTSPRSALLRVQALNVLIPLRNPYQILIRPDLSNKVPVPYINPKLDTLWLVNFDYKKALDYYGTFHTRLWYDKPEVGRIAIPCKTWHRLLTTSEPLLDIVEISYRNNAHEVLLVVGGESFSETLDIVFIKPRDYPEVMLPDCPWLSQNSEEDRMSNWNEFEETSVATVRQTIDDYVESHKNMNFYDGAGTY